jgi:hypothetical protein
MSNAAHPGFARTDPIANGPGASGLLWHVSRLLQPYVSHSAAEGALPTLFAATSPEAKAGGYYGPNGFYEMKGPPVPAKIMPQAKDARVAAQLWDVSAALTGVSFDSVAEHLSLFDAFSSREPMYGQSNEGHPVRRHRNGRAGRAARMPARC